MLPSLLDAKINKHMSGSKVLIHLWSPVLALRRNLLPQAVYSQKTCAHQGTVYCSQEKSLSYYWEGSLLASDCYQMGICIFRNIVSPTFEPL
ncbi:hypothetical protein MKW98_025336 [Papaver atlanticum]|uniref:Uncharacterized protein n=1 Tax=Papaver atlanticum TaxID=357466 RepID=A0AAD4S6K1_9MAGN|nr:hypothetical protein MKW98_025336 [Papaver atlanticum]